MTLISPSSVAAVHRSGFPSLSVRWAAVAVFVLAPLVAADAAAESLRLDLPAALERARHHSRALADAEGAARAAAARANAVRADMLPQVRVVARHSRLSEVEPGAIQLPAMVPGAAPPAAIQLGEKIEAQTSLRASLEQPLFSGGALWHRWRAEGRRAEAAAAMAESAGLEEDAATTDAFLALLQRRRSHAAAERHAEALRRIEEDSRGLRAAGRLTDLDRDRLLANLAAAEARRLGAEAAMIVAEAALRQRLGIDDAVGFELDVPTAPSVTSATFDDGFAFALARQPGLAAARHGAEAAQLAVRASRGAWMPRLALLAGWTLANPNERYFPVRAEYNDTWDASIVASWDLWRGGADHYRAQAAVVEAESAARRVAAGEDAIALGLRTLLAIAPAREAEAKAAAVARDSARAAAEAARALFLLGRISVSEMLEAEAGLAAADGRAVDAESGLVRLWADWMRLTGGQTPGRTAEDSAG